MSLNSTVFNMGAVLNKLRSIEKSQIDEADPGMDTGGAVIDQANFTRIMGRLNHIKDAVSPEHFNSLRAGVRSLHMNRRPTLTQMNALMDLLETMLSYVADDQTLFQRLKYDLAQDGKKDDNEEEIELDDEEDTEDESEEDEKEDDADSDSEEEEKESDLIGDKLRDLKS